MKKALVFLLLIVSVNAFSQDKKEKKEFEMKTYYMVFLKKGPNRSQDSATAAQLQVQHLAHITKMYEAGKLCIAGPFMEDGDIRGICVYTVAGKEEALKLANEDPAVKAGRLVVEVHEWYTAKGGTLP